MIIETDSNTYWRIRDQWLADTQLWRSGMSFDVATIKFRQFLYSQGARADDSLVDAKRLNVCDSVGTIPGVTRIVFDSEQAYVWFVLKWL